MANLYGTLEIGTEDAINGQTSAVASTDVEGAPEFEPGLAAYELPTSAVDGGGVVACG